MSSPEFRFAVGALFAGASIAADWRPEQRPAGAWERAWKLSMDSLALAKNSLTVTDLANLALDWPWASREKRITPAERTPREKFPPARLRALLLAQLPVWAE